MRLARLRWVAEEVVGNPPLYADIVDVADEVLVLLRHGQHACRTSPGRANLIHVRSIHAKATHSARGIGAAESEAAMEQRELRQGTPVVYVDEHRNQHYALVTERWSDTCVNLVFVLTDPKMRDQYGQQIRHELSVVHGDSQSPPRLGRCWLFPDEVK